MQKERVGIFDKGQTSALVLLAASSPETVSEMAGCLDYRRFNLLVTRRQADAVFYLQGGLPDVLVFEPSAEMTALGLLEIFLSENKIRVPVLLLVGEGDGSRFLDRQEYSFDELLTRPVNPAELSARLNSLVKLSRLEDQVGYLPKKVEERTQTVLLVEDSPVQRKVLARYLEEQNIEVVSVASGEEALEAVRRNLPDLVLLDLVLPGMDGLEVCRRLKQFPEAADIPVVFITAQGSQEEKLLCLESGADDFLVKPVHPRELIIRTGTLLRRKKFFDALASQASRDPLTGLYNRRQLTLELERELARAKRYGLPLGFIILDVDFFKHYNDVNGHLAGDDLLRRLAGLLKSSTRQADTVFRYGGEEFVVLLPQTGLNGAVVVAEKLRVTVAEYPFFNAGGQPGGCLTISLGVAVYPDHGSTAEELISAADKALYQAKKSGRNRYAVAEKTFVV